MQFSLHYRCRKRTGRNEAELKVGKTRSNGHQNKNPTPHLELLH